MPGNLQKKPIFTAILFLVILICSIYSNTLQSGWYLDDYQNITHNPGIQISQLDFESLKKSLYAAPGIERISRPLSYFSFALNWYLGQEQVLGYRVVNIGIHILAALFLYVTILLLLQSPNVQDIQGRDSQSIYFIALLTAVLWAIHPIQTQAITYIVQRMASMAALFYMIGIFCYIKGRLTLSVIKRTIFWCLCLFAYFASIATKINAIMLPIFLLAIEFIFFQDLNKRKTKEKAVITVGGGIFLVAISGIFFFLDGNISKIIQGYENRPFTLMERMLTQPRVVLFYLSQIAYPIAERFNIAHDFTISTSLFRPWTTLPSILGILLLTGAAFFRIKANPIFAFAIIFFLGNHFIESSVIPLEMVFEHRNYLPSMFLFFPVSVGVKSVLDYYSSRKIMFVFLVISVCGVLVGLGMSTYIRNADWLNYKSLWGDTMAKSPALGRPPHNLAWGYYEPRGQVDIAIQLYEKATKLKFDRESYRADPYSNLGSIYYFRLNDYKKTVEYASKAIEIYPDHNKANLLVNLALGKLGRYDEALQHLSDTLAKYPNNVEFNYLKGYMLLRSAKYETALEYFRKCLQRSPNYWTYQREIGLCLTKMEYYERGYRFLKSADASNPNQSSVLLSLIENRIMANDYSRAKDYAYQFIELIGVDSLDSFLLEDSKDNMRIPVSLSRIVPLLQKIIVEQSENNKEIAQRLMQYFSY